MAFPAIQTADTKNGVVTSNTNAWTLTYPTNLAAGDLILAFMAVDGTPGASGTTWPSGFVQANGDGLAFAATLMCRGKISDGTETGNFTVTLFGGANEQGAWRVFRITGWFGSGLSDVTGWASNGASTQTDTPDPPDLNPANWDVEDTLWFAACAVDTSRTISVYPLANNQTADVSGGANGATLGICTLDDAVASKNPGTFTISNSDDARSLTLAVRPAAATVYQPRHGFTNYQNPGVF